MKKDSLFSLSLAFVLALAGLSGSAFAADQAQDAYDAYAQKAAPLEQQLYAKQAELNAVSAALQPDTAKAQQLFKEIAELEGQLFAAGVELRSRMGNSRAPYGGMYPRGEFGCYGAPCGGGMYRGGAFARGGCMGYAGGRRGGCW